MQARPEAGAPSRALLINPRHTLGQALNQRYIPPTGLLTLASYIEGRTGQSIPVYDANGPRYGEDAMLEAAREAAYVGISVWFSSHGDGMRLVEKVRKTNPHAGIIIGGPNTSGMSERILRNQPGADYVVEGDGEKALQMLLQHAPLGQIPGLAYRAGDGTITQNTPDYSLDLQEIPPMTPKQLVGGYTWQRLGEDAAAHSAFPVSTARGCFRTNRCDYCSIPVNGRRHVSPERFWEQIDALDRDYGIDYVFETADIFPVQALEGIIATRPDHLSGTRLRGYLHPGMVNGETLARRLKGAGFVNIFMGVENVRYFAESKQTNDHMSGRYASSYTIDKLVEEVALLGEQGITVMPSFVLGIPGESAGSLQRNVALIEQLATMPNVDDMSINMLKVLPGSAYFKQAMQNPSIVERYGQMTGTDLLSEDNIDYILLSDLFVRQYCDISPDVVRDALLSLQDGLHGTTRVAHWEAR